MAVPWVGCHGMTMDDHVSAKVDRGIAIDDHGRLWAIMAVP